MSRQKRDGKVQLAKITRITNLTAFRKEGSVASRLSSSRTQKRITSAGTSVLCVQHLPRRRLGREASFVQEKHVHARTPKTLQRSETCFRLFVSLRYPYKPPITTLSILLKPILGGRKRHNAATVGNTTQASTNSKCTQAERQCSSEQVTVQSSTKKKRQGIQPVEHRGQRSKSREPHNSNVGEPSKRMDQDLETHMKLTSHGNSEMSLEPAREGRKGARSAGVRSYHSKPTHMKRFLVICTAQHNKTVA